MVASKRLELAVKSVKALKVDLRYRAPESPRRGDLKPVGLII